MEALMYRWLGRVTSEGEMLPYQVDVLPFHPRAPSLR